MKKTKVTHLRSNDETKRSYVIKVDTHDDSFRIPVVDVRDGEKAREMATSIQKARNVAQGSKFFQPSFSLLGYSYNHSAKK